MANTTLTEAFSDIADAIRAKGVSGTMTPLEMPTKIGSIAGGGSKYGISLDSIIGDVDQNGELQAPSTPSSFSSDAIVSIPEYTFYNKFRNGAITSVNLPNLTSIGAYAFQYAFYGDTVLQSISMPSLQNIISPYALSYTFNNCTSLRSIDFSSLTTIGVYGATGSYYGFHYAFNGCTSLRSIAFPSLTEIHGRYNFNYTFQGCTSLESASFPKLTTISQSSNFQNIFYGCTSLKNVYLPKLENIASSCMQNAFYGCTALEIVDFSKVTQVPYLSNINTFGNTNNTYKIVVPNSLYDSWITSTNWSNPNIKPHIEQAIKAMTFTAGTANSTVSLVAVGNPSPISLEVSTDGGGTFSAYTIGNTITLANVDDVVMFRCGSNGNASISDDASNYYKFVITGTISCTNDVVFLLDQNGKISGTLPDYCFYGLFYGCTGLTSAPTLPNNAVGQGSYGSMFSGCTGLTSAPELPSTTLDNGCYASMFYGCTSLTTAPELPVTTLASLCYASMFEGCTSLMTAPILPATTLASDCYNRMFFGCSSLNYIKIGYTGNFSTTYFNDWVNGVSSTGEFYYNGSDATTGTSAIPSGWTVKLILYPGLTFTARQAGSTISMRGYGGAPNVSLQYSTDDGFTWNTFTVGSTTVTAANVGDRISFRATTTNSSMSSSYDNYYNYFVMTGQFDASGNINSLLNGIDMDSVTTAPLCAYPNLFQDCTALVDASNLKLASITASQNAYGHGMFRRCTNLVHGPEIMATNLFSSVYTAEYMFENCSSLQSVKIHATATSWNSSSTIDWMKGVPSTGTFYYNGSLTNRGRSYIPTGWTITPFAE